MRHDFAMVVIVIVGLATIAFLFMYLWYRSD